ncbi:unnamed protein product [Paramecium primaurelia]|uniref:Uncharacterized protein n=1 Tax=Paramecium primaurelia TaxID=5886 RepID=A0A8S1N2B3_PARPR|nr:unnamed protein product [Paramecium primaurelia]
MKSKDIEQNNRISYIKTMPIESTSNQKKQEHAKTEIITNKSAILSQNQRSLTHSTIINNFYLPNHIKTVRDQLLIQKEVNEKVYQSEDSKEWFKGKIIMSLKFGYCKYYKKKQYYYEGQFCCGLKHGKGLIIYEDGSYYQGDFFADKILGDNCMFKDFEDNCSKNTKIQKKVKLEFPNGAIYEGSVLDGKRHGKGIYTWKDGTKYEGQFENDQINGFGIMEYADSKKYKGEWVNGEMEGFGNFIWPNSEEYKGFYKQSKKNGFGVFKYSSGITYFGEFVNGLNHGTAVLMQFNHQPKISKWQDGQQIE